MANARSKRCGVNFNIGEDMVFQILQWLPVASLIRFKSVCKSWYSLIQTSDFINHHFYCKDSSNLILIGPCTEHYPNPRLNVFLVSDDDHQNSQNLSLPRSIPQSFILDLYRSYDWYVGICNGIICIRHDTSKVSLWNPATRESRLLPHSPFALPDEDDVYEFENIYFGFVYDPKIDDYKVIRFRIEDSKRCQVEVYTLRTDSWRKIDFDLRLAFLYHTNTSLGIGIHCWCGIVSSIDVPDPNLILSFDINKEVFGTISIPKEYRYDRSHHMLATLGEKLAYIRCNYVSTETETHLQIFVLKDFGVEESWALMSKLRLSSQIGCQVYPKGVLDNKIIFLVGGKANPEKLCLVDPVTEEVKSFPVLGTSRYSWKAIMYKESLVSIKRTSGAAKEGD